MVYLALGVMLWAGAHLTTTLRMGFRETLIARLGAGKHKGLFSLAVLASVALMVVGWRCAESVHVYDPPLWNNPLTVALMMFAAVFLFVAAKLPGNVNRAIRHPQLVGVAVWAVAHLLSNGDNRSLALFGGLGFWALLSVILTNRREGVWHKPAAAPFSRDATVGTIAAVAFAGLFALHPYFAGMEITIGF